MASLKYSRQREAIKTFLLNRSDHPTADIIYSSLREEYPNISLGTVYRNLSLLTELGEITKISTGNGAEHYDGNRIPHQHFVCTCCHGVFDIYMDNIASFMDEASRKTPGRIDSCRANFYGICEKCLSDAKDIVQQN